MSSESEHFTADDARALTLKYKENLLKEFRKSGDYYVVLRNIKAACNQGKESLIYKYAAEDATMKVLKAALVEDGFAIYPTTEKDAFIISWGK